MTPTTVPDPDLIRVYEAAEQRHLRSLPPEHFTEAVPQAMQRKITTFAFDLVARARPQV